MSESLPKAGFIRIDYLSEPMTAQQWKDLEKNLKNFTIGQRFGTWFLNLVPGAGSLAIMHDWKGAIPQWLLSGAGVAILLFSDDNEFMSIVYSSFPYALSIVFSTIRSITYDRPSDVAYNKYGYFNVAVLPNKRGNLNAYLLYNKAF